MDPLLILPPEIINLILGELDVVSVCKISQCSKGWKDFNEGLGTGIWKQLCLGNCLKEHILSDLSEGFHWKEILIRNYGYNGIKKDWYEGRFSNVKNFCELPSKHMCPMDAETWGEIFEMELNR